MNKGLRRPVSLHPSLSLYSVPQQARRGQLTGFLGADLGEPFQPAAGYGQCPATTTLAVSGQSLLILYRRVPGIGLYQVIGQLASNKTFRHVLFKQVSAKVAPLNSRPFYTPKPLRP